MVREFYIHREDERIAVRLQEAAGDDDWEIVGGSDVPKIQKFKTKLNVG
jgi:hypothetical protein